MMNKFRFLLKRKATKTIESTLNTMPEIEKFIDHFKNSSDYCFIVGGFIRDILVRLIHNRNISPRDLDIVVSEINTSEINATSHYKSERTPLGGHRIFFKTTKLNVDIWPLKETIFFNELGIQASLPNLLNGFPFDVERAAFDVKRKKMIDCGAIKAIIHDRIEHNPNWIQKNRLHINAARAISISQHTGMSLHPSVVDMIKSIEWMTCRDSVVNFFQKNEYTSEQIDRIFIQTKKIAEGGSNG